MKQQAKAPGIALVGAATRAPFASIVFLFELTRDYNAILPLMLATVIATLLASAVMHDSIMTEKLTRRGLRVPSDYHADILRTTLVSAVMTTQVETVHATSPLLEVAKRFQADGHSAYPVVDSDDGHLVGIITRSLLLRDDDSSSVTPIQDIAHLPVIDGGRLVVICTRTDVMRARQTQLAHEQPEPGWRRRNRPGISGPPNLNTDEDGEA